MVVGNVCKETLKRTCIKGHFNWNQRPRSYMSWYNYKHTDKTLSSFIPFNSRCKTRILFGANCNCRHLNVSCFHSSDSAQFEQGKAANISKPLGNDVKYYVYLEFRRIANEK